MGELSQEQAAAIYGTECLSLGELRLLNLSPGSFDVSRDGEIHELVDTQRDPIKRSLFKYPSDGERPDYEALSYRWGDHGQKSIQRGNEGLPINDISYAALLRLRDANRPRWLWIDEICINQYSLEDRAQQVKMMHRIYKSASTLLIW